MKFLKSILFRVSRSCSTFSPLPPSLSGMIQNLNILSRPEPRFTFLGIPGNLLKFVLEFLKGRFEKQIKYSIKKPSYRQLLLITYGMIKFDPNCLYSYNNNYANLPLTHNLKSSQMIFCFAFSRPVFLCLSERYITDLSFKNVFKFYAY